MSADEINGRFQNILRISLQRGASDIHLVPGEPVRIRINGDLGLISDVDDSGLRFSADETALLVQQLIDQRGMDSLTQRGSADGALTFENEHRIRFNLFRQGGSYALALRRLDSEFRSLAELGLGDDLLRVCNLNYGLVLVAGPTGSGKSTTLATLLDQINRTRSCHIITIEDPVEYVHTSHQALVSQRQIGIDSPRFDQALVDALRQDPDVILVGEVRDLDTIRTAITAAETGHLVFASVHAGDAVGAIERLVGVFPADEQPAIQRMLGMVVRCVVAQHLLVAAPLPPGRQDAASRPGDPAASPPDSGGRVLASEILWGTPAVANLIASGQTRQLVSIMETGTGDGMVTLDSCLTKLFRQRRIPEQTVRSLARNPQMVMDRARGR